LTFIVPFTVTVPVALIVIKLVPVAVKVVPFGTLMLVKLNVLLVAVAIVQVLAAHDNPVPLHPPAAPPKDRSSVPSAPVPTSIVAPPAGTVVNVTEPVPSCFILVS
jgi:hypothetical protein